LTPKSYRAPERALEAARLLALSKVGSPVGNWKSTFPATQEDERFDRGRKIAGGASCRNEDSRDIGRLILRTAGRCKVRSSKGIVSTRAAPKRRIENGESMSGLPIMWNPKEIGSQSAGQ